MRILNTFFASFRRGLQTFQKTMPSMPNGTEERKSFDRLPKTVVPQRYDITLKPDLQKFTFTGKELIDVSVREATDKVILNAASLEISSVSFLSKTKVTAITAVCHKFCTENEILIIQFPDTLEPGEGQLSIEFEGELNDKLKGFYRSKYTTPEGETRFAATTQFEPTDARRAFPCWDEPSAKARFDMTIVAPKDRVTLSNMNVISETPYVDPNFKVVKFATTPIMSTYLLAFVIGEYDHIEGTTVDGTKVRVYTPLQKTAQGQFALEVALKALPFFQRYFKIDYPLPKMDLIAIADFSAGAMENWGLVTYREPCLLVDPANTSTIRKQHVAITVAHELAHQWFGNLVTMEWWTHLWLNEGFASFMEYLCVDHLFPNYDVWTQCVTHIHSRALDLDGLHNSHPIEVPVGHTSEIDEIFDDISYNKGASVIRMLHSFIGDQMFSDGLSSYLKKHSYQNTVTEDLWNSLEAVSKKPIAKMMTTWTKQKGFPVINVTSRQDGKNRILTLTQEKFCSNGRLSDVDKNTLWMVPISISTQSNPKGVAAKLLLESRSTDVVIENVAADDWVKLNPGSVGFYRVNYPPEMLAQLLPAVKDKSLPPLDRLGLQSDLFAVVKSGKASTVEILKLMMAFIDEDNYSVWDSITSCLGQLNTLFSHTDYQDAYHAYGRRLMSKIHSKLGWDIIEGESHLDTLLRNTVLDRLVVFRDEVALAEARKRFEAHVNGTYVIPADIRGTVYRAVAGDCDDKTFETLFALFRKAEMQEEKNRISYALAVVRDLNRIEKVMQFAVSDEVRSQDSVFVLMCVGSTKEGREPLWRFFRDNHKELESRFESGYLIGHLIKSATQHFASEEKALEVEQFFSKNPVPSAERALQQTLESIRLKAEWLARDVEATKAYLLSFIQ